MKKLFISMTLLICVLQMFAQRPTADSYFGLKAGVASSINFIGDSSFTGYSLKYKPGFSAGLYYNISFGEKFSLQPELSYSQRGSKIESTQDQSLNADLELGYVSVPFLLKFSPVDRFAFFAGPQLNFLINAKINYESRNDKDLLDRLEGFDPAVAVGLEFWITRNIGIYASDVLGLGNVNKDNPGLWFNEQTVTGNISNFAFQAGITIGFPPEHSGSAVDDADGDNIPDKDDRCPNVRGTVDNLGCPEMVLHYRNDEAILDSVDKANLDIVTSFLENNPKLKIIIEGHTSTVGESDYNQKLSEKRVNASLAYLVSKGISKKRMKAMGYGEQYPIGDNDTEEGRAMSRRVVIRIAK